MILLIRCHVKQDVSEVGFQSKWGFSFSSHQSAGFSKNERVSSEISLWFKPKTGKIDNTDYWCRPSCLNG